MYVSCRNVEHTQYSFDRLVCFASVSYTMYGNNHNQFVQNNVEIKFGVKLPPLP